MRNYKLAGPITIMVRLNKIANYLFCQMCANSDADFGDTYAEQWYTDGLEFIEDFIEQEKADGTV